MTMLVANHALDMSQWDTKYDDASAATIGDNDATHFVATGANHVYTVAGESITYSGMNVPNGGTIHDLTVTTGAKTDFTLTGADIATTVLIDHVGTNDWSGLEPLLFSGDDTFVGSKKADHLIGFEGNDTFDLSKGGSDIAEGGNGNDTFELKAQLSVGDQIDGGDTADLDTVSLNGDYTGFVFGATTMTNVESVILEAKHNYDLTLQDANISGNNFTVDGSALGHSNSLTLSMAAGSALGIRGTGGRGDDTFQGGGGTDDFHGGDGHDVLRGKGGDDFLQGGGDADTLTGGNGRDGFYVSVVNESSDESYDTITDFDAAEDTFLLGSHVHAIDTALTGGALSAATFSADLAAAVDAAHLLRHDAVLFTPDSGDFAGDTFLIVDVNGGAGYQSGDKDIVILLSDASQLAGLDITNFVVPV